MPCSPLFSLYSRRGLFHSAVADLVANAINQYVGVWAAAPGLAQLEANVVRWFCDIIGYPTTARGFLTSGGSLATFSAVVTARRERLPENFLSGILYASDQAHHSVQKAALLAGFPPQNIRAIPSSVTLDPHKGLFLPFGTGSVSVSPIPDKPGIS